MIEPQSRCVQSDPIEPAAVRVWSAMQRPIVNALTAQRRARLAEMDAHLMSPPRFQPALDEGEISQFLNETDMGHGTLSPCGSASRGRRCTTTPAVSAIANQP